MKIVLVSHSASLAGGGERSLVEIAAYLQARPAVEVVVVVPGKAALARELASRGVTVVSISYEWADVHDGVEGFQASLSSLNRIVDFLETYSPDVVMTNTSVVPWFAYAASLLGIPHAWFLREFVGDDVGIDFYPSPAFIRETIQRFADVIFVNSEFMKNRYAEVLGREDICVIYPTVGRQILDYLEEPADAVAESRESRVFRMIVYGTILPAKNQLEALQAAAILRRKRDDFVLTIMGGTAARDYLDSLVAFVHAEGLEDYVRFLGHEDDPYPIVAQQDICIVPSTAEPFGRTTVEAMLLRKAVVASDAGGNREILGMADGVGLLYPLGHPEALATHLDALMRKPESMASMGATAQAYALQRFCTDDGLSELYERLKRLATLPKAPREEWIAKLKIEAARQSARYATQHQQWRRTQAETIYELEEQLAALRSHLSKQDEELEQLRPSVAAQERQLEALRIHLRAQDTELEQPRPSVEAQERQLEALRIHLRAQDEELEQLRPRVAEQERQLEALRMHLRAQDTELGQLRPCISAQETQLEQLRQHLRTQDAELKGVHLRAAESELEKPDQPLDEPRKGNEV